MITVQHTTDYRLFKPILGNRHINKEHVNHLVREMQRTNLLDVAPIIVNEKMEVVDGQHRLEAAKALGIEVSYAVVNGLNVEHIVRLNTSQKKWRIQDYVALHISLKNQEYIDLKAFSDKWKVTLAQSVSMLSMASYLNSAQKLRDFQEGRWKIINQEIAEEEAKAMTEMREFMRNSAIYRSQAFSASIRRLLDRLDELEISFPQFREQFAKSSQRILFSHRVIDYMRTYEEGYNENKRGGRVSFA